MKIGVVGLGIAGLRTAMLLERQGFDVEMFEARGRPGGRLHTIDEGGGAVYEAGGEWIDADHYRAVGLLKEFHLDPDARDAQWPGKAVYKGKVVSEDALWNDALEDDLRVEAAARELCRDLNVPPWANGQYREMDSRTLDHFLREQTVSERGLWWVTSRYRSDEGDDPDRIGLLGWLCGYRSYLNRDGDVMSAYRVPGGARSLCEKMLASLRGPVQFGAELRKVHQDPLGVTLHFEDGSVAKVDKAVLTLAPRALERVVFEPAFSVHKRCCVEACGMGRSIKIVWQFAEPWWQEQGWGGSMHCDGPLQQTWSSGLGDAPVLTAYVNGRQAADWAKLGDPVRTGLYELAKLFPDAAKTFVRGWFHDWVTDQYSFGSFSHLPPGYVLGHMEHISSQEEHVHFAGEHTSQWTGFIEGALESAERVVGELGDSA